MNSEELAWKIRRHGIEMTHISNGSHIGAVLSIADIVAVLYTDFVDIEKLKQKAKDRTRVILSKGHAGAVIYAALAEKGLIPVEELKTHYANGSRLSGHVSHKNVPGVEVSTGSLGQGVGMAAGIALAGKKNGLEYRTFAIVGDGECDEGSVWEMALFAHQQKLTNFTVIVDHNKQQGLGDTSKIMDMMDIKKKWEDFGWNTVEIDGHNHKALKKAMSIVDSTRPTCIIADTIKGKGVPFMENNVLWHYRAPQGEDYTKAIEALEAIRP